MLLIINHIYLKIMLIMVMAASLGKKAVDNKPSGLRYYCVTDGVGGFIWTKVRPDAIFVSQHHTSAYCTIITIGGFIPKPNKVPDATEAIPTSSVHRIYRLII
jgi:hypothetical protein